MNLFSAGTAIGYVPLLIVLLPLLGAFLTFFSRRKPVVRDVLAISTTVVTWVLALTLIPYLKQGPIELELKNFLVIGLSFRIDYLSLVFLNLFTTVWMLATIYASVYMSFEHSQTRFFMFLLITYTGCLGVVAAGDFFTLFLFFEMMAFCSYVLVIHEEDEKAMKAGNLYLFLGVIGGLALLLAIFLMYDHTGTMAFTNILESFQGDTTKLAIIVSLFTLGFGLKAGMAPLHIWLPQAHPIAPSPASALLSGIMIKTGAYGLIRVFASSFSHLVENPDFYKNTISTYGYWLIWAGIITMFLGAFLAFFQTGAKHILAYSSVSQIGYIIMGIGSAAYLGSYGAMAMSGVIYHTINHALFKGALFLTVGAIYIYTHDLDITRVRGLGKKYKFLMIIFIISAFGIAGVPGFNAYPSKSILHHGIVEAFEHNNLISLWWAEKIFTLSSALTVCYFIKLFRGLFLGELPEKYKNLPDTPLVIKLVLTVFASLMIFIGIRPHTVLKGVVLPAVSTFGYSSYSFGYVEKLNVFNRADITAIVTTFAIAFIIYYVFEKFNLYRINFPSWMSVEKVVYQPLAKGFMFICLGPGVVLDRTVNQMYHGTGQASMGMFKQIGEIESSIDKAYGGAGNLSTHVCQGAAKLDGTYNQVIDNTTNLTPLKKITPLNSCEFIAKHQGEEKVLNDADFSCKKGHCPFAPDSKCYKKEPTYWEKIAVNPEWNLKNLNFDGLIVVTLFTVILVILVFFSKAII